MTDTLPCCDQPSATHPWCCVCRCFHHMPARYDAAICQACDALLFKRGVRRCKTCEKVKPLRAFDFVNATHRRRHCRACVHRRPGQVAYQRGWRARNKERINARERARYPLIREKHRAQDRASYYRHRPKRLARMRAYRAANQESIRLWTRANRAQINARRKVRQAERLIQLLHGGTR